MKVYVYSVRDKKLGAYSAPVVKNDDPEHLSEIMSRSMKKMEDPQQIVEARDCALYYLGQFDDIKGKFECLAEPEKLLDYEDYLPRKEEIVNDGKN